MPILGFTPVCTMAKELAVALASNHLLITENFQAPTFTATEVSWSIIKGQCYIRKVRAESVCPTFHLRMFSDSGTISPKQRTSRLTPSLQLRYFGQSSEANVTSGKSGLSQSVPSSISGCSLIVAPSHQVQVGQIGN